jgi:ABC-type dipeptide/oligopeptide/nickel transport system permease component
MILGTVLLFGAIVSVMNLVVDILYPLLDPRVSQS